MEGSPRAGPEWPILPLQRAGVRNPRTSGPRRPAPGGNAK